MYLLCVCHHILCMMLTSHGEEARDEVERLKVRVKKSSENARV